MSIVIGVSVVPYSYELEYQFEVIDGALQPGEFLWDVGAAGLESGATPTPEEAAQAILPSRQEGDTPVPRFERLDTAKKTMKAAASNASHEVVEMAKLLGMILTPQESTAQMVAINPAEALYVVEGGGMRTSVVRRSLAAQAIRLQGLGPIGTVYQIGSDRPIPRLKNDKENPEYKVAQEIAGDHLPPEDTLTEFGLNYDSARQAGFARTDNTEIDGDVLSKNFYMPRVGKLQLVKIANGTGGLPRGFDAIEKIRRESVDGKQWVIATNGQYRPKSAALAIEWAQKRDYEMIPPIALGDEPGYSVIHDGNEIVTGEREPFTYVSEAIALHRILSRMRVS